MLRVVPCRTSPLRYRPSPPPPRPIRPWVGAGAARFWSGKRGQWLAALGISAGIAVPLYIVDPAESHVFPRCPIYAVTGLYCSGCGSTRAVHQLLHGHLLAALRLNPLTLLLLPGLAYAFLSLTREAWGGRSLPPLLRTPRATRLLIALVLTFTILRNIRRYPFTLLAPPP